METLFEGLTESEIEYLQYLQNHGYFDGLEMNLNDDTSTDYRIQKFEQNGYITLSDTGPYPSASSVTLTGKGIAALIDYEKYQTRIKPLYDQIQSLQQMADSLKKQTELAESEAHSAKQETLALQRISDSLQEQTDLARAEAHSAKIDAAFSKIFFCHLINHQHCRYPSAAAIRIISATMLRIRAATDRYLAWRFFFLVSRLISLISFIAASAFSKFFTIFSILLFSCIFFYPLFKNCFYVSRNPQILSSCCIFHLHSHLLF